MISVTDADTGRRVEYHCAGMEHVRTGVITKLADIKAYVFVLLDGEDRAELIPKTHLKWR